MARSHLKDKVIMQNMKCIVAATSRAALIVRQQGAELHLCM